MDSYIKVSEDSLYINIENDVSNGNPAPDIQEFLNKIENKNVTVGVIGLGYSGLQIATALASSGISVTGIEFDREKVKKINRGVSYIENVSSETLGKLVETDRLYAVHDMAVLSELDVVIISDQIPSRHPLNKDISFMMALMEKIIASLEKPQLIIIDTVMVPGTTRDVLYPLFVEQKKSVNADFFLAVAPERTDPGNKKMSVSMIPRVVAGITKESRILASALLQHVTKQTVQVSSPLAAEMVKFFENSYRWVNSALVNEMMMMCNKLGISVWEVMHAVKSNPFDYFRYLPSPGYGVTSQYNEEPFELFWKKALSGLRYDILGKAIDINTYITRDFIVDMISELLNDQKKCLNGANILIVGIANKKDVGEWNESSAVEIIKVLINKKVNVYYHDPLISHVTIGKGHDTLSSIALNAEMLAWVDLTVILMDHSDINFETIVEHAPLILDTKNVTHGIKGDKKNIKVI
ncbi:MAG: nucleotide sugar dehydrogenase [Candidatus Auribacterota bacterium]|jgi:UDP-N-acetyl-D-glucosamine dehydrogenase